MQIKSIAEILELCDMFMHNASLYHNRLRKYKDEMTRNELEAYCYKKGQATAASLILNAYKNNLGSMDLQLLQELRNTYKNNN